MKLGRCLPFFVAVFMLVAIIPFSVAADPPPFEVFVDATYDVDTPGWGVDRFDSIQDGIDAVALEGTVYVNAGTYNENLTINKSLSLMGAPGVILDGTALGGNGIFVTGGDVTIFGLEITNFGNHGIRVPAGESSVQLTIRGCEIHNNSSNGISIGGSVVNNVLLDFVEVHNNGHRGLYIVGGAKIISLGIVDSNFYGNGYQGVLIAGVGTDIDGFTIVDSTFTDNVLAGLRLNGDWIGDFIAIRGSFDDNGNGLAIAMISGIETFLAVDCSFSGNSNCGVAVFDAGYVNNMRLERCEIDNNTNFGILLDNVDDFGQLLIVEGSISGNGRGVLARGAIAVDQLIFNAVIVADNNVSGIAFASGEYGVLVILGVEFANNSDEHIIIGIDGVGGDVTVDELGIYYCSFDLVPGISVYLDGTTTVNDSALAQMCWWGLPSYPYGRFSDGIEVAIWALDEDFNAFGTYYEIEDATDPFEIWDFNLAFVDLEELDDTDELVFESAHGDYTLVLPARIIPDGVTTAAILQRDVDYWLDDFPEWIKGIDAAAAPTGFMFHSKVFLFFMVDLSSGLEPTEDDLVTEFGGNFTLTFYFDPDDIDDLDRLDVYWFDGDEWVALGGVVDEVAGTVTVEVDHWSDFVLMEDLRDETPVTGTAVMWFIPLGLLMLAGGVLVRRKVEA